MDGDYIRVRQCNLLRWSVLRGPRAISLLTFKLKSQAVAYARAISFSGRLTLYVDDEYGLAIRQDVATLTYPRVLN